MSNKIKSVRVTKSITYSSEPYLEFCAENDETPSQAGFLEFIGSWIDEDFNDIGIRTITEIEE